MHAQAVHSSTGNGTDMLSYTAFRKKEKCRISQGGLGPPWPTPRSVPDYSYHSPWAYFSNGLLSAAWKTKANIQSDLFAPQRCCFGPWIHPRSIRQCQRLRDIHNSSSHHKFSKCSTSRLLLSFYASYLEKGTWM